MTRRTGRSEAGRELRAARTLPAYAKKWRIATKTRGYQPFRLNAAQLVVYAMMVEMGKLLGGIRVRVLKYRQLGLSTLVCAIMQKQTQTHAAYNTLSMADKQDLPEQWVRRGQRWHRETPASIRPHIKAKNKLELYFDGLDSRYTIGSAEGQTPGMGYTLRGVHCSELSNWRNTKKIKADMNPALPTNDADSVMVDESTGEIEGDDWYETFMRSWRKEDDWKAVFLPWSLQGEYRRDAADILDLSKEEQAMVKAFGLDREQLAWRRWQIRNMFGGDAEMFACKYPLTVAEAFLSAGRLVIPRRTINWWKAHVVAGERVVLEWVEKGKTVRARPATEEDGDHCWEVWQRPDPRDDFIVAGDVMEGKPADPADDKSPLDYSAGVALNRRRMTIDALYHGRPHPDIFGVELMKAAIWFNNAWATPEVNNPGWASLTMMKGYRYLYLREGPQDVVSRHELGFYAWKTTPGNRDWLIDHFIAGIRPSPVAFDPWEGRIFGRSDKMVQEFLQFLNHKTGKRQHRAGGHDDIIFAMAIAFMLHASCPRGDNIRAKNVLDIPRRSKRIEVDGGADTWVEDEDEDLEVTE